MPQHATKQKLQSWLTCRMLCCCIYIGLAAEQLANRYRYAYCDCYYTGGSGFHCFPLPMVPLSPGYSRHFGALAKHCFNTRRLLPPVIWVMGSVWVRIVLCNLPHSTQRSSCKARYRARYFRHVRDEKLPRMSTCESQGKRDTTKSQSQRQLAV